MDGGDAAASGELLLLLLDTSLLRSAATYGLQVDLFLQQLLIFLRAHQLLSEHNHQAIMALTHSSSPVLLTPDSLAERGSSALPALLVGRLTRLLEHEAAAAAGAAQQQQQQQADPPEVALSAGLSRALCYVNRYADRYGANARHRAKPRLLALMGACDMPLQYIPVMNAIFAAQAAGVVLDALLLGQADSAFLQQATHLTGGLYVRATQPAGLLQYLLGAFSADSATREALSISGSSQVVDYRASCFCHKTIIDTGYICSVCLSIFCKANMKAPQCLTCGAPFTKGAAAAQAAGAGDGGSKGGQTRPAAAPAAAAAAGGS